MSRAPRYATRDDLLFDEATIAAPHALLARLRAETPLARIGDTGVHTVASWDLVEEALGRERDFSANLTGVLHRDDRGRPRVFELPPTTANAVIATADEPDHARHRSLVAPGLDRKKIDALEPLIRRWVREALAERGAAGGGDAIPMAERVPARAVAHVLGLPDDDVERFRVWAMMGGDMLAGDVDGERLGFLARETADMAAYLGDHLDRAGAGGSTAGAAPLLGDLAEAVREDGFDRQAAVGISIVLFGAGGESTAALLGSCLRLLAEAPDLARRLRRDPELVPRFVEEVVRLESPFNFHYRVVRRACTLGGYDLAPGDRLMLLWAAANRDPAVHDEPDTLRLDRRHPKRHMGFGRGAHFCVGAPLARLEARVMVEEVLGASGALALRSGDEPAYRYAQSIFVRRLESLSLGLRAAA